MHRNTLVCVYIYTYIAALAKPNPILETNITLQMCSFTLISFRVLPHDSCFNRTSVLLCIYMHRLKWSLIAKQSVCLVDPISMLLSRLRSQILSQLLSQLRSQRRSQCQPFLRACLELSGCGSNRKNTTTTSGAHPAWFDLCVCGSRPGLGGVGSHRRLCGLGGVDSHRRLCGLVLSWFSLNTNRVFPLGLHRDWTP